MALTVTALLLAIALPSASPSPLATTCPTTDVQRIKVPGQPDREWRAPVRYCTGIACKFIAVLVTVNPDGTVKNAVIQNGWEEEENNQVLQDARESTYRPKTVNCQAVEGTYIFRELFVRVG
jgi:hypothetical protein